MLGYQRYSVAHRPAAPQESRDWVERFFGPMTLRNYHYDADCWLPAQPMTNDTLIVVPGSIEVLIN